MFPAGWDLTRYPDAALSAVLPVKSCVQRGLAKGGCRLEVLGRNERWNSHQSYVLTVLSEGTCPSLLPSRVSAVESGGKWRVVSSSDVEMNVLRPLHTSIYNRLSSFSWLLRGEAKASSFKDFTLRKGEVFVSGDYESATDNLNMYVQKVLLSGILRGTVQVPDHVKELALASQSMQLSTDNPCRITTQRSGQLMGNLLSFPLLCIVNYLAFRYYTGNDRSIPVRINGDDIVFRSSPAVSVRWSEGVLGSGLKLSKGKTSVDSKYFSLNSKIFKALHSRVKLVPTIRSTAFGWGKPKDPVSGLSGRWARVLKDYPTAEGSPRRRLIEEEFLKTNMTWLIASRRSITRALEMRVSYETITRLNLWRRECFYLSLEREEPICVPPAVLYQNRIPLGWERRRKMKFSKHEIEASSRIGAEFVELAWSPATLETDESKEQYKVRVATSGYYYSPVNRENLTKKARLLHLSSRNTKRFLAPSVRAGSEVLDPRVALRRLRPQGKVLWLPPEIIGAINWTKGRD